MQILNGSIRHRSIIASTACGSASGTSSSAGASIGTPPRRAINSARWAPVRVSRIATTLDFMRGAFNHHNANMSTCRKMFFSFSLLLACAPVLCDQPPVDAAAVRQEFIAALQRIRLHQPDEPDSPALQSYAIHDYLI